MAYYILKVAISAILIVLISECAKKNAFAGAMLASIPLVSVLAMIWLYIETKDIARVSELSYGIFWLVIPSLTLFVSLPMLLRTNLNFYVALGLAIGFTALSYLVAIGLINHFILKE